MPSTELSLSVVVTNYDGEAYLPGMMAALQATGYPFLEIIVSDDASTDGSRLLLRHQHPSVRVITSDRNRGPAPTRNAGIAAARGDLVLLLDNDGHPYPDAIEPLVALFQDPELVGAMPRVLMGDDPEQVHYDGARTHISGQMWLLNTHRALSEAPIEGEEIASMVGTAMIFRRKAALDIGGFEEDFFFYYEDHDFGTRLRTLKGRLRSCPASRILHHGGTADLSFRVGADYPKRRMYLTPKNRWLFILRNLQGRSLGRLAPLLIVHELAQAVFIVAKGWCEPAFAALCWNIGHLGRTLRKRELIQRGRIAPDIDIIQEGELPLHPGLLAHRPLALALKRGLDRLLARLFAWAKPGLERDARRFRERESRPKGDQAKRSSDQTSAPLL